MPRSAGGRYPSIMGKGRSYRILGAAAAAMVVALAAVVPAPAARAEELRVAQADCYAIGQQVAAQNGGTLAKAQAVSQNGQTVCVIVVLVPGKDGQRPRRVQVVVPAG